MGSDAAEEAGDAVTTSTPPILDRLTDAQVVALTLVGEARGEPLDGMIAVAQVIGHRTHDARWPNDWRGVCWARKQFSCWNVFDSNRAVLERLAPSLVSGGSLGTHRGEVVEALWIADGVMAGRLRDLVHGACHYHALSVHPRWAAGHTPIAQIGNHRFYNDVA